MQRHHLYNPLGSGFRWLSLRTTKIASTWVDQAVGKAEHLDDPLPFGVEFMRNSLLGMYCSLTGLLACPICMHDSESIDHLFTGCSFATAFLCFPYFIGELFCFSFSLSPGHAGLFQSTRLSGAQPLLHYGNFDDLDSAKPWIFSSPFMKKAKACRRVLSAFVLLSCSASLPLSRRGFLVLECPNPVHAFLSSLTS